MAASRGVLAGLAVASVVVGLLAASTGVATAGHDPEAANFTVTPLEDRSPGAENVRYGQTVVGTAGEDLETLTGTVAIYEAGDWRDCGPTSASVFGIDRGDTHDGYEVDEELTDNVKSFSAGEDRLETEYNGEDDLGASTYFDDGDEFVSVADCIDNPDTAGWYRIIGRTTGITPDGETVTFGGDSHYFWICECEDEAAARERLGPPPSEPDPTATPERVGTSTATPPDGATPTDGTGAGVTTETDAVNDPAAAPTHTATTPADADGATATVAPSDTARGRTASTPEDWDAVVHRTPTSEDGAGVGPIAVFAALFAASVLRHCRN